MRTPLLAPALAAILAAAPPLGAAPFTAHFVELHAEVVAREATLPVTGLTPEERRQRAAIRSFDRAYAVPSDGLAGDLGMAKKACAALERGFPGDAPMAALLAQLGDRLEAEVRAARDDLEGAISFAEVGNLRSRAEAKLAAADAALVEAGAPPTQARRMVLLRKALRLVARGMAAAVKAGPAVPPPGQAGMSALVDGSAWAANSDFGTAVGGIARVSTSLNGVRSLLVTGRRILPSSADPDLPGDRTRLEISFTSITVNLAPGTYTTGSSGGIYASATWYRDREDGSSEVAHSAGGTITVDVLDVHEASVDVAGTFDLTLYDGIGDVTHTVAGGVFQIEGLPRSTVP
jgi:hypothetical protein